MAKKYENIKEFKSSWYAMTSNRLIVTLGALKGEVNCDICVVGAGFTGLSAALELVQKGFSVALLDAQPLAMNASSKNGGHLIRGYNKSPAWLAAKYGLQDAKLLCNMTLEGLALILERIKTHDIKCDLKFGHLTAALNDHHIRDLRQEVKDWEKIGHKDLQVIDEKAVWDMVRTEKYKGGLYDPKGGHFHPHNYLLGLAHTAQRMGVKIYDETKVMEIVTAPQPKVITAQGAVNAKFVILAGATDMKGAFPIRSRSITAQAHMIATEPLGERRARDILPRDVAVTDCRFLMDYYRLSHDNRLLFGGNCNYSDVDYPGEDKRLRQKMVTLFPALKMTRIDHCWRGPLDMTINRLPHVGRLAPQVFYAHGFGGHGVLCTNLMGKVLAEAVGGTATRFDVFAKIGHAPLVGGSLLKRPLFVLGMLWYRLRDLL